MIQLSVRGRFVGQNAISAFQVPPSRTYAFPALKNAHRIIVKVNAFLKHAKSFSIVKWTVLLCGRRMFWKNQT
jgi:hypothetical protein